jgi:glutamine synthetase
MHIIRQYIVSSEKVLFEGNNIAKNGRKRRKKEGLPNVKTTPLALDFMVTAKQRNCLSKITFIPMRIGSTARDRIGEIY